MDRGYIIRSTTSALYNLGFQEGRAHFMSNDQFNSQILNSKQLKHLHETEANEYVRYEVKEKSMKYLDKFLSDINLINELYEKHKEIIKEVENPNITHPIKFVCSNTRDAIIDDINQNMNLGRKVIENYYFSYKKTRSTHEQRETDAYKLGYALGQYAEMLLFYGTCEQKHEGIKLTQTEYVAFPDKHKLVYIMPDNEDIFAVITLLKN